MILRLALLSGVVLLAAACADAPRFASSAEISASGSYPALQPLGTLLDSPAPATSPEATAALQARAAALQRRGAGLASTETDLAASPRLRAALASPAP